MKINPSIQNSLSTSANTSLLVRIVLFLAFFGHGLVSLGYSPSYKLHAVLISSINIWDFSVNHILIYQGILDIILAFAILFKLFQEKLLYGIIFYLIGIGFTAMILYYNTTDKIFGIAEFMRRLPWIFTSLFLIYSYKNDLKPNLLRYGLGFAFLSHGLASLGIWGLNAGHIELADNIIKTQEDVMRFVFVSGVFDTIIGIILLIGFKSLLVSRISLIWILFVVTLSFVNGVPDGIFRTGFLVLAIIVAFNKNCHSKALIRKIIERK